MMLELNVDEELYSFEIVKYSTANTLFSNGYDITIQASYNIENLLCVDRNYTGTIYEDGERFSLENGISVRIIKTDEEYPNSVRCRIVNGAFRTSEACNLFIHMCRSGVKLNSICNNNIVNNKETIISIINEVLEDVH